MKPRDRVSSREEVCDQVSGVSPVLRVRPGKCSRGPLVGFILCHCRRHASLSPEWNPRRLGRSHLLHLGRHPPNSPGKQQPEESTAGTEGGRAARTCPAWLNPQVFHGGCWVIPLRHTVGGLVHMFISPFSHTARQPAW